MTPRLPPLPELTFDAAGAPRAQTFDDIYFSKHGGLEETEAVFLDGCGLPERWRGAARFTIAELGFGAGLNALATWRAWRAARAPGAILHFISIEAFPMGAADAARALAPFDEVAPLRERLLARWPVRAYGPQRLWFAEDGFALTVLIAPVEEGLQMLSAPVDAWFLDGFAPARNPQMWAPAVIERIARLSGPGATLASYTAAGAVRRDLAAAGFAVEKRPGFAGKRERIVARLASGSQAPKAAATPRIAIVGGGIAGACLAHACARRGLASQMFVAGQSLADAASGNPAGLVMPRLDRGHGALPALYRAAYLAALDLYAGAAPGAFFPCGVLHRPDSPRAAAAFADLLADPPLPDEHMRPGPEGAIRFPRAGVVRPVEAIERLAAASSIALHTEVAGLEADAEAGWRLLDPQGQELAQTDIVFLAAGAGLARLPQTRWLPLAMSRGQVEHARMTAPPTEAVAQSAYLAPTLDGVVFGATFIPAGPGDAAEVSEADRAENLMRLRALAPDLSAAIDPQALRSRAALRATTPDRAPCAGPTPDLDAWRAGRLGAVHEGVYILGGLGARGLTLAPLLAEVLVSLALGEPPPVSPAIAESVAPERFLRRAVKRGETIPG